MVDAQILKEELLSNPYKFICEYVEEILPNIGKETFKILSLSIPSLIIPDIPYEGRLVRSNIHTLFLANPGSGKSEITQIFKFFSYEPQDFESVTNARFEEDIGKAEQGSMIVGDCSRMLSDPTLIKTIEGILEEKRINRKTKRGQVVADVNYIGLLCGTPQDLTGLLTGGLLFRFVPLIIFHSTEQHSKIGKHISDNLFEESDIGIKRDLIKAYYQSLIEIQNEESSQIDKVIGYKVSKEIKDTIYHQWDKVSRPAHESTDQNWFRELHEAYRFLLSHAFLNIYNREVTEDGYLIPNQEDLKIALQLFTKTTEEKSKLLKSKSLAYQIESNKQFKQLIGNVEKKNRTRTQMYTELFTDKRLKK